MISRALDLTVGVDSPSMLLLHTYNFKIIHDYKFSIYNLK